MNILFLSLSDYDSLNNRGLYSDLMREFAKNGHMIYIISPVEKRKKRPEKLIVENNCQILKIKIGNITKTNFIEKGISTITLESKLIYGIKRYFNEVKFDLILYTTPPVTFQKVIRFLKKRDKAKTYLILKDIFPQNAVDLGILSKHGLKGILYRYFRKKEKLLYKYSDYIGCMSEANVRFLLKHNPELSNKIIEVCPNSIEPINYDVNLLMKKEIRDKYNIPQDKIILIYGGNLGKPQGIDFVIECIRSNLGNDKIFFLIIGSGTEFNKLQVFFDKEKPRNARLLSYLPKQDYEQLVCSCDVGLIFLDKRFTIPNFPSRLLSYMQTSLPILAATDVNTDLGEIIERGNFGLWCESGDIKRFNQNIEKLYNADLRKQMGINARKYLEDNYTVKQSYDIIIKHFVKKRKNRHV